MFELLPSEILAEVVQNIELGALGPVSQVNRQLRLLSRERLVALLPKLAVRMTVRQGQSRHLCAEFEFQQLNFGSTRVRMQVRNSYNAAFEADPLSPHPMVRYLRVSSGKNTTNLALSRPIILPVRQVGQITSLGHQGEVALSYSVEERDGKRWMRVTGMDLDLSMLALPSVTEKLVQNFPPASLIDWLRFQLFDPQARTKENARFRAAVPWAPFVVWRSSSMPTQPAPRFLYYVRSSISFNLSSFSFQNLAQTIISLFRSLKSIA